MYELALWAQVRLGINLHCGCVLTCNVGTGSSEVSAGVSQPDGVSFCLPETQSILHLGPHSEDGIQAQKWHYLPFQVALRREDILYTTGEQHVL